MRDQTSPRSVNCTELDLEIVPRGNSVLKKQIQTYRYLSTAFNSYAKFKLAIYSFRPFERALSCKFAFPFPCKMPMRPYVFLIRASLIMVVACLEQVAKQHIPEQHLVEDDAASVDPSNAIGLWCKPSSTFEELNKKRFLPNCPENKPHALCCKDSGPSIVGDEVGGYGCDECR